MSGRMQIVAIERQRLLMKMDFPLMQRQTEKLLFLPPLTVTTLLPGKLRAGIREMHVLSLLISGQQQSSSVLTRAINFVMAHGNESNAFRFWFYCLRFMIFNTIELLTERDNMEGGRFPRRWPAVNFSVFRLMIAIRMDKWELWCYLLFDLWGVYNKDDDPQYL